MKKLTIEDFKVEEGRDCPYVTWDNIKEVLGVKENKKFCAWMAGQTCYPEGVYTHDLEHYLEERNRGIEKPAVFD